MASVIPSNWNALPETIKARFGSQAGKQRAMVHEGHLLLVLHVAPAHDELDRRAAIFWRDPSGAWKSSGAETGGLKGLRELVDHYRSRSVDLEQKLEQAKRAADYFAISMDVAPLNRSARHLHKTLQDAREAIPTDRDLIALRDAAAEVERTTELTQADAKSGLDFIAARRAEEQAESADHIARSTHKLNLIAAMFLPMSALGGVFGVNLAHGLENFGKPYLFWAFVAVAFFIGFVVRANINRREPPPTGG